jgi:epsilon-lactone hydrolase
LAVAGVKGKLEGITARAPFNGIIERVEAPEGVNIKEDAVGGISGWWAKPAETREGIAMMHLHGGWFNWGTAQAFCNLVGHIALRAGAAFIPDYRALDAIGAFLRERFAGARQAPARAAS